MEGLGEGIERGRIKAAQCLGIVSLLVHSFDHELVTTYPSDALESRLHLVDLGG